MKNIVSAQTSDALLLAALASTSPFSIAPAAPTVNVKDSKQVSEALGVEEGQLQLVQKRGQLFYRHKVHKVAIGLADMTWLVDTHLRMKKISTQLSTVSRDDIQLVGSTFDPSNLITRVCKGFRCYRQILCRGREIGKIASAFQVDETANVLKIKDATNQDVKQQRENDLTQWRLDLSESDDYQKALLETLEGCELGGPSSQVSQKDLIQMTDLTPVNEVLRLLADPNRLMNGLAAIQNHPVEVETRGQLDRIYQSLVAYRTLMKKVGAQYLRPPSQTMTMLGGGFQAFAPPTANAKIDDALNEAELKHDTIHIYQLENVAGFTRRLQMAKECQKQALELYAALQLIASFQDANTWVFDEPATAPASSTGTTVQTTTPSPKQEPVVVQIMDRIKDTWKRLNRDGKVVQAARSLFAFMSAA